MVAGVVSQLVERARTRRPRQGPRCRWSRVLAIIGSVVTVVLLGRSLRSYLPDVGRELRHPQVGWLAVAVAAELVSMVAFSELQRTMLRAGGMTVSARRMLGLTFEANALSGSLPAGAAFAAGYRLRRFRAWGSSAPAAGFTFLATGLVSTLAFGVLAVVSAWVANGRTAGLAPAALAVVVLIATVLAARQVRRHPAAARRALGRGAAAVGRLRRRRTDRSDTSRPSFIDAASAIRPTVRDWSKAVCYASINWVADLACLLAAGSAVGVGAPHVEAVVVAYIAGMSVAGFSLAPGGLGTVEATMIFALSRSGGTHASAIGSVLLYRLISYVLMVLIGWALWLIRRRRGARMRASGGVVSPSVGVSIARAGDDGVAGRPSLRGEAALPAPSAAAH